MGFHSLSILTRMGSISGEPLQISALTLNAALYYIFYLDLCRHLKPFLSTINVPNMNHLCLKLLVLQVILYPKPFLSTYNVPNMNHLYLKLLVLQVISTDFKYI